MYTNIIFIYIKHAGHKKMQHFDKFISFYGFCTALIYRIPKAKVFYL